MIGRFFGASTSKIYLTSTTATLIMSTKKLINKAEDVVEEMIQGIVACHPSLVRIEGYAVLLRSDYLSRTSEVGF